MHQSHSQSFTPLAAKVSHSRCPTGRGGWETNNGFDEHYVIRKRLPEYEAGFCITKELHLK